MKFTGRSLKQTAAVEDDLPDWTLQPWIYCSTGPLQGQVYTLEQWQTKARAQQRMRDAGNSRGYGPLDYVITMEGVEHPSFPGRGVTGRKAVLDPSSHWKPADLSSGSQESGSGNELA